MCKSHKHITEEAAEYGNVSDSLDYELRGSRGKTWQGRWIMAHRELVIRATMASIIGGTLRPGRYRTMTVVERDKVRHVQCISLLRSIGIHAVMKVVEERITRSFVADTAASIKGRGGTYLLRRILRQLQADKRGMRFVYKDDIRKCYQSVDQDLMMRVIRKRFRDRRLVRILERWVRMLAEGMSIGMRPSQGLVNLLLSIYFDHIIKEEMGARHAQRYCDDRVIECGSLYGLTELVRRTREATADAGLDIKPSAQVWDWEKRPLDFLGYVIGYDGSIRIRKHIKQRFARRWKRVRSVRRRRELIGSFYGISKHAHARHLFTKLTGINMTTFSELGFIYQRDGKKEFAAETIKLARLSNRQVTVKDFETGIKTREGDGRYIVLAECDGRDYKFFTNSQQMKAALDHARSLNGLPFDCEIVDLGGNNGYMFK